MDLCQLISMVDVVLKDDILTAEGFYLLRTVHLPHLMVQHLRVSDHFLQLLSPPLLTDEDAQDDCLPDQQQHHDDPSGVPRPDYIDLIGDGKEIAKGRMAFL